MHEEKREVDWMAKDECTLRLFRRHPCRQPQKAQVPADTRAPTNCQTLFRKMRASSQSRADCGRFARSPRKWLQWEIRNYSSRRHISLCAVAFKVCKTYYKTEHNERRKTHVRTITAFGEIETKNVEHTAAHTMPSSVWPKIYRRANSRFPRK